MNAAGGDWFVIQQKYDPLVTSECRSGRQYNFCSDCALLVCFLCSVLVALLLGLMRMSTTKSFEMCQICAMWQSLRVSSSDI